MQENYGRPYKLILAAVIANFNLHLAGCVVGFSSPTIPVLLDENNDIGFTATKEEVSWVVALMPFGASIGPFFAGVLAVRIGRKSTLLLAEAIFLFGYLLILIGRSIVTLLLGRFVHGIAVGFIFTVFPMYIAEISTNKLRGALASLVNFFICSGLTMTFTFGYLLDYQQLVIALSFFPVLVFTAFIFMPETPHYYILKNKYDKGFKSLRFFRVGPDEVVTAELMNITASIEASMLLAGKCKDLYTNKINFKAMYLGLALATLFQFSGINVVTIYMQPIFQSAKVPLEPGLCAILMGCVQQVCCCFSPSLTTHFGRKPLLFTSAMGMTAMTTLLGVIYYLKHIDSPAAKNIRWLPIISMVLFYIFFTIGVGSLILAVVSELYAPNIRAIGMTLTTSYSWFLSFVLTKYFITIETAIGTYSIFWIFATTTIILVLFLFWKLPETKDKPLEQIQKELAGESTSAT